MEKLLKLDPKNTELLSQKQKLLADSISATKDKLATLKTAAEQANTALANGDISQQQYDALQREIVETENELKRLEAEAQMQILNLLKSVRQDKSSGMQAIKFQVQVKNFCLLPQG